MKHGPAREALENMKLVAKFSGLSIEQVADLCDAMERARREIADQLSTTGEAPPLESLVPASKKVQ